MNDSTHFISPTAIAEHVSRSQVLSPDIRPLWDGARLSGPAYTVRCAPAII
ncbi:hypothetical protein NHF46_12090 [Arthrobacter alpinus]|nr:hypothetical protein [Arthrobacter alpinus]